MGEAKRRREYEACHRIPDDVRVDIASLVRSLDFSVNGLSSGLCLFRMLSGKCLFDILGLPASPVLGGMVYRAGPDRYRDVVSFCGSDNVGQLTDDGLLMGHWWLESGDDFIDFSCGDWQDSMRPELMIPE